MKLPDLLIKDLNVVFCGTAAGDKSAQKEAYYAGPGNKFYRILYKTGLTPTLFQPSDYSKLIKYSIGLTDLVKTRSGNDNVLSAIDFDIKGFKEKITLYSPKYVCFNGKASAAAFLYNDHKKTSRIEFGPVTEKIANTKLFVAPSTSGSANGFWDEMYWFQLKDLI